MAISEGKIKVGDDLNKYVVNNNIKIIKIPLFIRLKKSFKGFINKRFKRKKYIEKLKKYNYELEM